MNILIHRIFRPLKLNLGLALILSISFISSTPVQAAPAKKKALRIVAKKTVTRKIKPRTSGRVEVPKQSAAVEKIDPLVVHPPAEANFNIAQSAGGRIRLSRGILSQLERGESRLVSENGYKVDLSIVPELQKFSSSLLRKYQVPWGAMVAIDPKTGRIFSMSSFSAKEPWLSDIAVTATYPAASIFKIITSAAAIESSGMSGDNLVYFRGGNYTLGYENYQPDTQKDRRFMKLSEALGRSINPVFARVALKHLSPELLVSYAEKFGFNANIPTDVALDTSHFSLPTDEYELARAGAGFSDATLSPLHAAALIGTVANKGVMMRPYLVNQITQTDGKIIYTNSAQPIRVVIERKTSEELLSMLTATTELGTARKQFIKVNNPLLRDTAVAAKTGTLRGEQPKGIYHWFVATAPIDRPRIAIATLVIDPGNARVKSAALAKEYLEHFFSKTPQ